MNAYAAAYNSGDLDGVMIFFSEESGVTGSQFSVKAEGIDAIRDQGMRTAAAADAFTISNVEVSGGTVTWDQARVSGTGQEFCLEGASTVATDGTTLPWDWSSGFKWALHTGRQSPYVPSAQGVNASP